MSESAQVEARSFLRAAPQGGQLGSYLVALADKADIPAQVIGDEAAIHGTIDHDGRFSLPMESAARIAILTTAHTLIQPEDPKNYYRNQTLKQTDAGQIIREAQGHLSRRAFRGVAASALRETVETPQLHETVRYMVQESRRPLARFLIMDEAYLPGPAVPESPLLDYLKSQVEQRVAAGETIDMSWLNHNTGMYAEPFGTRLKGVIKDAPKEVGTPLLLAAISGLGTASVWAAKKAAKGLWKAGLGTTKAVGRAFVNFLTNW